MDKHLAELKASGEYDERVSKLTGFAVGAVTYEYGAQSFTVDASTQQMQLSSFDINRHFEQAGRLFGEGLHKDYWRKYARRPAADIKLEIIVLANDTDMMEKLVDIAEKGFYQMYHKHSESISHLPEKQRNFYDRLIQCSARPIAVPWEIPQSIDFNSSASDKPYDKHLYVKDEDKSFATTLNPWEDGVLREEMENGKRSLLLIAHGALIAAAYVVLVVVFAPVSFDEAQIRAAEALTILQTIC